MEYLAQRKNQSREAIISIVKYALNEILPKQPKQRQVELLTTLITITEGKIYVEQEYSEAVKRMADIHLAEDMTDSVIYVIKSDTTLNAAAEKLELIGVDADDIRPKLLLSQYEKTQIIEMTLIWDNADEGILILNALLSNLI